MMAEFKAEVEWRDPVDLTPYERNAKTHPPKQVEAIARQIDRYGFDQPILIDDDGVVLKGHGRRLAAIHLGLRRVPVIVRPGLTSTEKMAIRIADNKVAESAWDHGFLTGDLDFLKGEEFDLSMTGFDDAELDRLLDADVEDEGSAEKNPDEEVEAPTAPVTTPGAVWHCGRHRILCGDSTSMKDVDVVMEGGRADLLFTSPPYDIQRRYLRTFNWDDLMRGVFANIPMTDEGQVLVNLGMVHGDNEWNPYWSTWVEWMRTRGWRRFGLYVWDQGPGLPGNWAGRLAPSFEFIFHFNKVSRQANKTIPCLHAGVVSGAAGTVVRGGMRRSDGSMPGRSPSNIQDYRVPDNVIRVRRQIGPVGDGIAHPAVFPVALPEFVMTTYGGVGDVVFEPFAGAGTTLLAGERTGRVVRAVEVEPSYVDVAVIRWQRFTGKNAVREDGRSYDEVAGECN